MLATRPSFSEYEPTTQHPLPDLAALEALIDGHFDDNDDDDELTVARSAEPLLSPLRPLPVASYSPAPHTLALGSASPLMHAQVYQLEQARRHARGASGSITGTVAVLDLIGRQIVRWAPYAVVGILVGLGGSITISKVMGAVHKPVAAVTAVTAATPNARAVAAAPAPRHDPPPAAVAEEVRPSTAVPAAAIKASLTAVAIAAPARRPAPAAVVAPRSTPVFAAVRAPRPAPPRDVPELAAMPAAYR